MRALAAVTLALTTGLLFAAQGEGTKVEVKGPHICCGQCVKVAEGLLAKIDGVSGAKADQAGKTVTFTAKDENAAKAGVKALIDGGFYGKAMAGDKVIKVDVPALKKGSKANVVVVKDVHVCCGACQKAINKIFAEAKVSYEGKGPQRTVRIEGTGLDPAVVIQTLHKTGFHGTLEK